MREGDRIRLKGGINATITHIGNSDFVGDPKPVYYTTDTGQKGMLMSNELKGGTEENA